MANLLVLNALSVALEAKDSSVRAHSHRVALLAAGLGRQVEMLSLRDRQYLQRAASLHDIGKVRVSEAVLNKPARLTPDEFAEMQLHAANGGQIARECGFGEKVWRAVRAHHERWDGGGYPDGLKGVRIPVIARIISVVDCYDALTEDRPYREAMHPSEALKIVSAGSGTYYDPDLVRLFLRYHAALREEMLDTPVPPSMFDLIPAPIDPTAQPQTGFFRRGAVGSSVSMAA